MFTNEWGRFRYPLVEGLQSNKNKSVKNVLVAVFQERIRKIYRVIVKEGKIFNNKDHAKK